MKSTALHHVQQFSSCFSAPIGIGGFTGQIRKKEDEHAAVCTPGDHFCTPVKNPFVISASPGETHKHGAARALSSSSHDRFYRFVCRMIFS
ncbi:MAG: hypothetical protein JXA44_00265 [Methanospirillaceae archaeon]|nr:hypothetical protein [Methanospirillaceae archaeon]